jgi:type I restriction enzyme S subunit
MGNEWTRASLLEHYDIRSGLSKPAADFGSGFPFLSFKDVFYNYFIPDDLTQLVQSSAKERENCSVKRGDIFLTRTSETMNELGMSSVALKDYENATFNGFSKRLRPKCEHSIYPEFIGYYLRSPQFRSEMLSFSTMSTRASLNNEMIGRLTIPTPPFSEQKNIAWTLKKLDEKIQLNRQTNQTLEQMAQALYKSWFVDFDPVIDNALAAGNTIPDELQERAQRRQKQLAKPNHKPLPEAILQLFPSEFEWTETLGWVPKGWEASAIGDVIENVGGGTPKTKENSYWIGGIHAFCTPKDMSNMTSKILINTERYLTDAGVNKISSGVLPVGTVLMSSRAPIGYLAITDIPVSVNQGVIALKPNESYGSEYLLCWAETNMEEVVSRANGSTFLEISKKNFRDIPFLKANNEALYGFTDIASTYFKRITGLQRQVRELENLRDTLLPKLISGELRLPSEALTEADKQLADAIA